MTRDDMTLDDLFRAADALERLGPLLLEVAAALEVRTAAITGRTKAPPLRLVRDDDRDDDDRDDERLALVVLFRAPR